MTELGNLSELEAELIKRNREIAKIRDEVLKAERRLEESQMRNDDLLEKVAELDGDVTKKNMNIKDLEKQVAQLRDQMDSKGEEVVSLKLAHEKEIANGRQEVEASAAALQKDKESASAFEKRVSDLEAEVASLQKEVEEERHKHIDSKALLSQAEASTRDSSTRSVEMRRQIQELQDELQQRQGMSQESAQQVEEERAKSRLELDGLRAQLEEHRSVCQDLEDHSRTHNETLGSVRDQLDQAKVEIEQHLSDKSALENVRDQVQKEYEEHKSNTDEIIHTERKRNEEHLERATQQAAQLDGRLVGQRMLLEEAQEALIQSEATEEQVAADLTSRLNALASEHEAAEEALARARSQAKSDAAALESRRVSELEAAEVVMQRQSLSELDAARRAEGEIEERHRRLESRYQALTTDHEEAQAQSSRQQEASRSQGKDLRERLAEAEERMSAQQHERDTLKKDVEEAKLEADRMNMAHRLEVERLQQMMEAEAQSRSSAEKIADSKLEEKDTLLAHRDSALERMTADLEAARKQLSELEDAAKQAREARESDRHSTSMRSAQLEGEMKIRQERVTELESRLDAQREYMEQLNATLSETQNDRESLLHTKGSLEARLSLELTQKDAEQKSLQQTHDEASKRCQELEQEMSREQEAHRHAIDDLKQQLSEKSKMGDERHAALESELLMVRQQYEALMRNKAELQDEVAQQRAQRNSLEAGLHEQRAEHERLSLELEQACTAKAFVERQAEDLRIERRDCEAKIKDLSAEVRAVEDQKSQQLSDFSMKVQKLDDLLNDERQSREAAEGALFSTRQALEDAALSREQAVRRSEQDLRADIDTWRDKADDLQVQLNHWREQSDVQRSRAEDFDTQRREAESQLRGEAATVEARLRRVETEKQIAQTAVDEGRAALAQLQASMNAKVAALEREQDVQRNSMEKAQQAKVAAEDSVQNQSQAHQQMRERVGMASEELSIRQVEFALDKQRLSGALEESRRTLRNSLGVQNPVAAMDSVRIAGLESTLSEERRKSIEQAVALQRAERRVSQLEDANKRSEEQRSTAVQHAREVERQQLAISEDFRKAKAQNISLDQKISEGREQSRMAAEELHVVRNDSKYELTRTRGALDELRYMLKKQATARPSIGSGSSRPSLTPMTPLGSR